jgi:hypothetical protein
MIHNATPVSAAEQFCYEAPIIGQLPPEEISSRLAAMGDDEAAAEMRRSHLGDSSLEGLRFGQAKAWQHTAQQIGYISFPADTSASTLPIVPSGSVPGAPGLMNRRISIKLDRLNVHEYPGLGTHQVMVVFKAQNQLPQAPEPATFSQTYRAQQGQTAAVAGYPIFVGLNTGSTGLAFELFTINVKNNDDASMLSMLDSDLFHNGLSLLSSFQPAIGPFSNMVMGVAAAFLKRHENVKVQHHYLGLDFSPTAMGVRLAEGNYVVVQVPSDTTINWAEWVFDRSIGGIVRQADRQSLPHNYLVFRIEQHTGV